LGKKLGDKILRFVIEKKYDEILGLVLKIKSALLKKYLFLSLFCGLRLTCERIKRRINIYLPTSRGLNIALLGPDGAGKTTIAKKLLQLPFDSKYVYMGRDQFIIPIQKIRNRWEKKEGAWKGKRYLLKEILVYCHRFIELYLRYLFRALPFYKRGYLIIYDRYLYDLFVGKGINKRRIIHKLMYQLFPKPDIVFYLNVDPKIAFERKKEHSEKIIEQVSQEYKKLDGIIPELTTINANEKEKKVLGRILDIIWEAYHKQVSLYY
jgi:thymidylate kinase